MIRGSRPSLSAFPFGFTRLMIGEPLALATAHRFNRAGHIAEFAGVASSGARTSPADSVSRSMSRTRSGKPVGARARSISRSLRETHAFGTNLPALKKQRVALLMELFSELAPSLSHFEGTTYYRNPVPRAPLEDIARHSADNLQSS